MLKRYAPIRPLKRRLEDLLGHVAVLGKYEGLRVPVVVKEVPGRFYASVEEKTEGGTVRYGGEDKTNV